MGHLDTLGPIVRYHLLQLELAVMFECILVRFDLSAGVTTIMVTFGHGVLLYRSVMHCPL